MMTQDPQTLGTGVGLRPEHFPVILEDRPRIDWFEAVTENYFPVGNGEGGRPLSVLETIRRDYPVVFHGVSLSVGGTDPLDPRYLERLKALITRFDPLMVSDHLCWTGVEGRNLHDLLPLPFTAESLAHVTDRVSRVQDRIGRRLLLENVSSYLTYSHSEMTEWEFHTEVARRSGCGLLLDVNNVYVSAVNQGFPAEHFIDGLPREAVGYFHLAGHSDMGDFLFDTHDHAVPDAVWELFRRAVRRYPGAPALIEWDDHIPPFARLLEEAHRADRIRAEALGPATARPKPSGETTLHA